MKKILFLLLLLIPLFANAQYWYTANAMRFKYGNELEEWQKCNLRVFIDKAIDIKPALNPNMIEPNLGISFANKFVAAIIPTIIPRNTAIATPPLSRVLVSMLPRIPTAADINSNETLKPAIVAANFG